MKLGIIMVVLLSGIFIASSLVSTTDDTISFTIVDFGDSSEQNEEKSTEKKFEENKLNNFLSVNAHNTFLAKNSKYQVYEANICSEVFLEIVTPPPEA